jgi:hypothetical protein
VTGRSMRTSSSSSSSCRDGAVVGDGDGDGDGDGARRTPVSWAGSIGREGRR